MWLLTNLCNLFSALFLAIKRIMWELGLSQLVHLCWHITSTTSRCSCSAVRQVRGYHALHSFVFSAFLLNSAYDASFRNSFIVANRFLPRGLFYVILTFIASLSRFSPLSVWPIQFYSFPAQIYKTFSCTNCSTSSFAFCLPSWSSPSSSTPTTQTPPVPG